MLVFLNDDNQILLDCRKSYRYHLNDGWYAVIKTVTNNQVEAIFIFGWRQECGYGRVGAAEFDGGSGNLGPLE